MFDSLPYRNDAASVFRRLIRSLPTRSGVLGVATCDKGLPAMMMALAGMRDLPSSLMPGGVTLPPTDGEDAGKIQTIGVRFAHGQISLEEAASSAAARARTPGGGCQFLGTAATAQVVGRGAGLVAAALGARAFGPAGLARHGAPLGARRWRAWNSAARDARHPHRRVHRATRWSSTRRLAAPRICCCTCPRSRTRPGCARPTVDDWTAVNRSVPRLVDALPNGPRTHPTVQVFLAGGVPEVMLHLRRAGPARRDRPDGDRRAARRAARLVGGSRAARAAPRAPARARRRRSGRRDHVPRRGARARTDAAPCPFPSATSRRTARSSRAPRSIRRRRRRRRLSQAGPARVFAREHGRDRRDQGQGAIRGGRRARADLPRADGRGHGGDLSAHVGAEVSGLRQAASRSSPTPDSPACRPAPASATSAPRRSPAARRQAAGRRHHPHRHRPREAGRDRDFVGTDRRANRAGCGRARAAPAAIGFKSRGGIRCCRPRAGCGPRCRM